MNAFQLIDEIAKLGIEWEVTSWCYSFRLGFLCPLQVYVGHDDSFRSTLGELLKRGVDIKVIRTVSMAADGYLHREDQEVMKYRDYMIKSWKFKPDAKQRLKKGWSS